MLAVFGRGDRVFFVYGFAESDQENLPLREPGALRGLADEMLGLGAPGLEAMLANGTAGEVICDG